MLEGDKINLVPPPEVTLCQFCGTRYGCGEPGLEFVSFDNDSGGDDIAAGLIATKVDGAGMVAYRTRDAQTGGSTTLVVGKPQCCSSCLKYAARLVGFDDTAPLQAEIADLREQLDATRERLAQAEQERQEAEATLRDSAVYDRLLNATPKPAAGKRQQPAKAKA